MTKFRKKPIVIEVVQWFPNIEVDGVYAHRERYSAYPENNYTGKIVGLIKTLEGTMEVSPGDWVITGVNGEKYPCKPDIFEKTYDLVEDEKT